jgi:hypothetical protein
MVRIQSDAPPVHGAPLAHLHRQNAQQIHIALPLVPLQMYVRHVRGMGLVCLVPLLAIPLVLQHYLVLHLWWRMVQ